METNAEASELEQILSQHGLQEYLPVLLENGFDSWKILQDVTEEDLAAMGFKLGHRRNLQRQIASARGYSRWDPLPSTDIRGDFSYTTGIQTSMDDSDSAPPMSVEPQGWRGQLRRKDRTYSRANRINPSWQPMDTGYDMDMESDSVNTAASNYVEDHWRATIPRAPLHWENTTTELYLQNAEANSGKNKRKDASPHSGPSPPKISRSQEENTQRTESYPHAGRDFPLYDSDK